MANGATPPRVVIVEDQILLAEALASSLHHEHGMAVTAVVGSAQATNGALRDTDADVVVMAWRTLEQSASAVARAVRQALPSARIVVMALHPDEKLLLEVLEVGCEGLVSKREGLTDLVWAVQTVHRGQTSYIATAGGGDSPSHLTGREREVLGCLAEGLSTHEISDRLGVSWHTVRTHVRNVISKLGARSRVGAVAAARRRGLIAQDHH